MRKLLTILFTIATFLFSPVFAEDSSEPNNTKEQSLSIRLGKKITASIHPKGDQDWYKLIVPKGATGRVVVDLTIQTKDYCPHVIIYDGEGKEIASHKRPEGEPIRVGRHLTSKGAFYIQVRDSNKGKGEHGYRGEWDNRASTEPYTLSTQFIVVKDAYEPNPSLKKAKMLEFGREYKASIYPRGDQDFFKIELPKNKTGRLIISLSHSSRVINPHLNLFDEKGANLKEFHRRDGEKIVWTLHPDKPLYYLLVRDGRHGRQEHGYQGELDNRFSQSEYRLKVDFDEQHDPNEPNNKVEEAKTITLEKVVKGRFFPIGDKEYYKLNVAKGSRGTLKIDLRAAHSINPFIQLFATDKKLLKEVRGKNGTPCELHYDLIDGQEFIICCRDGGHGYGEIGYGSQYDNQMGWYECRASFKAVAGNEEPNDTVKTAKALPENTEIKGTFFPKKDIDSYSFQLPAGRHLVRFNLSQIPIQICPKMTVFKDDKKVYDVQRSKKYSVAIGKTILSGPGRFVVQISDGGSGWGEVGYGAQYGNMTSREEYVFSWSKENEPDQYEVADKDGRSIAIPSESKGAIFPKGDHDNFVFTLNEDKELYIAVHGYPQSIAPLFVLKDSSGKALAERKVRGQKPVDLTMKLKAGKYTLVIKDGQTGQGEVGYGSDKDNCQSLIPYTLTVSEAKDKKTFKKIEEPVDENLTIDDALFLDWVNQPTTKIRFARANKIRWFDLGLILPGELIVKLIRSECLRRSTVLELFAKDKKELLSLGKFSETQGRGFENDEAFSFDLREKHHCYLAVKKATYWARDEALLTITHKANPVDNTIKSVVAGKNFLGKIWPHGKRDIFSFEATSAGQLLVTLDHVEDLPFETRMWRNEGKSKRVLHLIGGRQDYDMLAHQPPGLEVTRFLENSSSYLEKFKDLSKEPTKFQIDVDGSHPYLLLRGHNINGAIKLVISGKEVQRQDIQNWHGWSEVAYPIEGKGKLAVEISAHREKVKLASVRLLSSTGEKSVSPWRQNPMPKDFLKGFDVVAMEGLTNPYQFFMDNRAWRDEIKSYVEKGGRFVLVCPQYYSYSLINAKGGGKILSNSPARSVGGLIEGRYQPWAGVNYKTEKLPSHVVIQTPGTVPRLVSKAVFHSCHSWHEPAKGSTNQVKEVSVAVAMENKAEAFKEVGTFRLEQTDYIKEFSFAPVAARFIKLTFKSNHGGKFTYLPEFELYGPDSVNAFFGLHFQSDWLSDRIVTVDKSNDIAQKMKKSRVNGWPSADCNGWFCGADKSGFRIIYGDKLLTNNRGVTLEKKYGSGSLIVETQELGYSSNRRAAMHKVHAVIDLPTIPIASLGNHTYRFNEKGQYQLEVRLKKGQIPWASKVNYSGKIDFTASGSAVEPNDEPLLPCDIEIGKTIEDTLYPTNDIDWFRFDVEEPSALQLVIDNIAVDWNPKLSLYYQSDLKKPIATIDRTLRGECGSPESKLVAFDKPGIYLIKVEDFHGKSCSLTPYRLTLLPTKANRRMEENKNRRFAAKLKPSVPVKCALYPKGDEDWFYVEKEDGLLDLTVSEVPQDCDPKIRLVEELSFTNGEMRILYLVAGKKEECQLDKLVPAWFPVTKHYKDGDKAKDIWTQLKNYDAVILDGLTSLEDFAFGESNNQKLIDSFINEGGRFILLAPGPTNKNLLLAKNGGNVISCASQWDSRKWIPIRLLDGMAVPDNSYGWCSGKAPKYPHDIVFAFAKEEKQKIGSFLLYNCAQTAARRLKSIELLASLSSPTEGFESIGSFELPCSDGPHELKINSREIKYLKLSIKANHGDKNEVQFAELCAFSDSPFVECFGVKPIKHLSEAKVLSTTSPQALKHTKGQLNGWGWFDLSGHFEGWEDKGFEVLQTDNSKPKKNPVTLLKRMGKGYLVLEAQPLGHPNSRAGFWKIYNLLDIKKPKTIECDGTTGGYGDEERLRLNTPAGRYNVAIVAGRGQLDSYSPVTIKAEYKESKDEFAPVVLQTFPPNGNEAISPKSKLYLNLSEPIGTNVDRSKITVSGTQSGNVFFSTRYFSDEYRLQLIPQGSFGDHELVTVTIHAGAFRDLAGNANETETKWSFKTGTMVRSSVAMTVVFNDKPPFGAGKREFSVVSTGALSVDPKVVFKQPNCGPVNVKLKKEKKTLWRGVLEVLSGKGDGQGSLGVTGLDKNGSKVSVSGLLIFAVDTTAPAAPKAPPKVRATVGGAVDVSWQETNGQMVILRGTNEANLKVVATVSAVSRRFKDKPKTEGDYIYCIAKIDEAGNQSGKSRSIRVKTDATAPREKPANFAAVLNKNGSIGLSWSLVNDAVGYDIYRTNKGAKPHGVPVLAVDRGTLRVVDTPVDGDYSYHIVARDKAGNRGPAATANILLDREKAHLNLQFKSVEALAPVTASKLLAHRCPPGTLHFEWTLNEEVVKGPEVTAVSANGTKYPLKLEDNKASVQLPADCADGTLRFVGSAEDKAGNKGLHIYYPPIHVDTQPPSAKIRTIRNEKPWRVDVKVNEPIARAPKLSFFVDGARREVSLKQSRYDIWTGQIIVTDKTKDGEAKYELEAYDLFGRKGTLITEGATFISDTTPPGPPLNPEVIAGRGGRLQLTWQQPIDETPAYYRLYRSDDKSFAAKKENTFKERIYNLSVIVECKEEKATYYKVTAVDRAGNEGKACDVVEAKPDSTPPGRPTELLSKVDAKGTIRLDWKEPKGEPIAFYHVYRTGRVVGRRVEDTFFNERINGQGVARYAVSAVDLAGNEGEKTKVEVTFDTSPPQASLAITPSKTGKSSKVYLKKGVAKITISLSEEVVATPTLSYRTYLMAEMSPLTLVKSGPRRYTTKVEIKEGHDGPLLFAFAAKDVSGNKVEELTPPLSYVVDTRPPLTVRSFTAKAKQKGQVELKWAPVEGESNEITYEIFNKKKSSPLARVKGKNSYEDKPAEGKVSYSIVAVDEAGLRSEKTDWISCRADSTPPPAPRRANCKVASTVQLTWEAIKSQHYRVYRQQKGHKAELVAELHGIGGYEEKPVADGRFTYFVTAVDGAGNESKATRSMEASFVGRVPTAKISLSPPPPIKGPVKVSLQSNCILLESPSLTFQDEMKVTMPVVLSKTGEKSYIGTLQFTDKLRDGMGRFVFQGKAKDGLVGSAIIEGGRVKVDRRAPRASVVIDGHSPFKPGDLTLTMTVDEDTSEQPSLYVVLPGEKPKEISLTSSGKVEYKGSFTIPETAKEGRAFFLLEAKDKAGNSGGEVNHGKYFNVDTTAPKVPNLLKATALKGGYVDLQWLPPIYAATERSSVVAGYKVYRSQAEFTETTGATLVATTAQARYRDKPSSDGQWYYAVSCVDSAGWESPTTHCSVYAKGKKPLPPVINEASTGLDHVSLEISSEEKTKRTTPTFNVYVRELGKRRQFAGKIRKSTYRGVPPKGGEFFFYATEVDEVGNESDFSVPARIYFKKVAPVADISLSPRGPVGPKGAVVKLTASQKLSELPQLYFSPPGGGRIAVKLEGPEADGVTYRGELKPPAGAKGGVGHFSWRGITDVEGKKITGVAISRGLSCVVDCTPPTCQIRSVSKIRRFNNVPVYPIGQHEVALFFSEELRESPRLQLRFRKKREETVNLEKLAPKKYRAFFKVDKTLGECDGHFLIQAFDRAGNEGTIITRGDSIRADTIKPNVVRQMRVALMPEGKVRMEWTPAYRKDGTLDKSADRFEVFRTIRELKTVEGLSPYRIVDHQLGIFDWPKADGEYRYAVRVVDRGGNEGPITKWAKTYVDKSPPAAPLNLTVRQTETGVVELSWDPPEGEKPLYYNAYIDDVPIRTIAGLSAMNERIPYNRVYGTPNSDGVYHFAVTAVDNALNESKPSSSRRLDYRALAPIASFEIKPDIWLTDKIYEVTLSTTEALAAPPEVQINSESGKRYPLTFIGKGKEWQARLKVTDAMPEGSYGFIYRGKDLQGNIGSEIAKGPLFHIDRTAPLQPGELKAQLSTEVDGAVVLKWRSPKLKDKATEVPYFYKVYRSTEMLSTVEGLEPIGEVKVEYRNQDHYELADLPPRDGRWYYAVTSLDLAKNASPALWQGPLVSVTGQPRAMIKLFTEAAGDKPVDRVGKGVVKVILETTSPLQKAPLLSYRFVEGEDLTKEGQIKLSGRGDRWQGTLGINHYKYEQDVTFTYRGVSKDGVTCTHIADGATFIVDTTGPVAELIIPYISRYRVNMKTNKLETPPVKEGYLPIELTSHKALSAAPTLFYEIGEVQRNVAMKGFGKKWRGFLDTRNGHPEGDAKFVYKGIDRQGNVSTKIAPIRKWYRTDDAFPKPRVLESFCTVGERFKVDTTAPFPPMNVELEVRKLGVAVLKWEEPEGNPARYRLYRSLTPIGSVEGMRPVKERIFAKIIVDAPPCDGNWFYVVTAVDIGGNESAPSKCVNMFVDSIKPELKIKPVPEGDGFFIVLDDEEVPPELSLTLKFPGKEVQKVEMGGTSGKLKIIPNYRHTGKPAVFLPQRVEAFSGVVKVVVHSPDPEGNIVESTTSFEGQTVTADTGGTVQSLDESVTLEIPPGLEPVVPEGPNKMRRIDGYDKLFFITYANIPEKKSKRTTGVTPSRNDLDPLPPGLEVVSKPYTVNINVPPSEPLMLKPKATQANLGGLKKLVAKLRMKIPSVGSEVIEDPDYLKSRLKVMKWIPATKEKRGGWERVPDEAVVLDPENKELVVPADSVTTYVIVSEQTPPSIRDLQPADGAAVTEMRPVISALIVDKGTGVALGAENRVILRLDGETIQLNQDNLSQGDPTEVKVTWQPPKELTPGAHIVTLEAEDIVGNRRVAKWRFSVDNRPPIIESMRAGRDGLVVLSALDPGGSLVKEKIRITVAGRPIKTRYVSTLNHIVAQLDKLKDGVHEVFARVVDGGGKIADKKISYLYDKSPPTISPLFPKDKGLLLNGRERPITISLADESGIDLASLRVYVDDKRIGKSGDKNVKDGFVYDASSGKLKCPISWQLTKGIHFCHVSVADKSGNLASLEYSFFAAKETNKVECLQAFGSLNEGHIVVKADKPEQITKVSGRQEDDPLPATYDALTGTILLETDRSAPIHLFLSDKADGELKATINPIDGTTKLSYNEKAADDSFLSNYKAQLFWALNGLLLLLLGGLFYYHRRRVLSSA